MKMKMKRNLNYIYIIKFKKYINNLRKYNLVSKNSENKFNSYIYNKI